MQTGTWYCGNWESLEGLDQDCLEKVNKNSCYLPALVGRQVPLLCGFRFRKIQKPLNENNST